VIEVVIQVLVAILA
jgi:hypothetical protein